MDPMAKHNHDCEAYRRHLLRKREREREKVTKTVDRTKTDEEHLFGFFVNKKYDRHEREVNENEEVLSEANVLSSVRERIEQRVNVNKTSGVPLKVKSS